MALDDVAALERLDPGFVATFPGGAQLALHRDPRAWPPASGSSGPTPSATGRACSSLGARAVRLAAHYWIHGDVAGRARSAASCSRAASASPTWRPSPDMARSPGCWATAVRTPELRALLAHFARFVGLDAGRAPAVTLVIPYLMATAGVWYPRGGVTALAQALLALATKLGAAIETDAARRAAGARGRSSSPRW